MEEVPEQAKRQKPVGPVFERPVDPVFLGDDSYFQERVDKEALERLLAQRPLTLTFGVPRESARHCWARILDMNEYLSGFREQSRVFSTTAAQYESLVAARNSASTSVDAGAGGRSGGASRAFGPLSRTETGPAVPVHSPMFRSRSVASRTVINDGFSLSAPPPAGGYYSVDGPTSGPMSRSQPPPALTTSVTSAFEAKVRELSSMFSFAGGSSSSTSSPLLPGGAGGSGQQTQRRSGGGGTASSASASSGIMTGANTSKLTQHKPPPSMLGFMIGRTGTQVSSTISRQPTEGSAAGTTAAVSAMERSATERTMSAASTIEPVGFASANVVDPQEGAFRAGSRPLFDHASPLHPGGAPPAPSRAASAEVVDDPPLRAALEGAERVLEHSTVNLHNGIFLPSPTRMVGGATDAFATYLLFCDPFVEAGRSVATTIILDNFTRSIVMTFRGRTELLGRKWP